MGRRLPRYRSSAKSSWRAAFLPLLTLAAFLPNLENVGIAAGSAAVAEQGEQHLPLLEAAGDEIPTQVHEEGAEKGNQDEASDPLNGQKNGEFAGAGVTEGEGGAAESTKVVVKDLGEDDGKEEGQADDSPGGEQKQKGVNDGDGKEEEVDVNAGFVPPLPTRSILKNGIEDMDMKALRDEVKDLPRNLLMELPPELWGIAEVKKYRRANKNMVRGQKTLDRAANTALMWGALGNAHCCHGEAAILLLLGAIITGIIAAPIAIVGGIQRRIGKTQLKKLKKHLNVRKRLMEERSKSLPLDNANFFLSGEAPAP